MTDSIEFRKQRTKDIVELVKFANAIELKIPLELLTSISEPLIRLRLNDSVHMTISKDKYDDDFTINIKLNHE